MSLLALTLGTAGASAQSVSGIPRALLLEVMPGADRFDEKAGDPPVVRGYAGGQFVGWVFLTQDIRPEQLGYAGPVRAIVGLGADGDLTGARVLEYYESYKSSMGDFLKRPGIQEQFRGKSIGDAFEVNGDIDGVSRATISTRAFARGIRNASRRVAEAYAGDIFALDDGPVNLEKLSWYDMRTRGVLKRILIEEGGGYLDISMTYLPNDSIAEFFVGSEHLPRIGQAAERRQLSDPRFVLYALEGPRLRLFLRQGWSIAQNGDSVEIPETQIYSLGLPRGGRVEGEAVMLGVIMLDQDELDLTQPFSLNYAMEGHEGHYSAFFDAIDAPAVVAAAPRPRPAPTEMTATAGVPTPEGTGSEAESAPVDATVGAGSADTSANETAQPTVESPLSTSVASQEARPSPSLGPNLDPLDFALVDEQSELARTIATTSWARVGWLLMVLALATVAFFLKNTALRYVALAATIAFLGFFDGSFLSISHVTAGIWVGPSVYLRDLPLLIMVTYTLVTTLIWGRVFCGVLCPFGALQDFIDRIVPKRFRRELPAHWNRRTQKVKYVVLAAVLLPAIAGIHASLYQYVEPFGTVFFLSPSLLLWAIAGTFLAASAVVPRFYCRYACPLGAALAVTSFLSLTRIRRVEQCQHCKVCEQHCPTGAIEGPDIDFKECVRCNVCETKLIEKAGVCQHDMKEVRSRLVPLKVGRVAGAVDA